uniref:hypothetical protein n=1 Tax=Staphylococcus aureus TaxID=1280 RepID=UPI00301C0FE6
MKELVCLKSIIKKSNTIEFVARVVFQMIPVTFREKLSLESNEPYSLLEDKHKFIFVHIPKCAGNAVIGSLFNEKSTGHIPIFKYKKADPKKY